MRVECEKCGRWFDDEFRSWNCPHRRINPGMSIDLDELPTPPAPPPVDIVHGRDAWVYVVALGAIVFAVIIFLRAMGR